MPQALPVPAVLGSADKICRTVTKKHFVKRYRWQQQGAGEFRFLYHSVDRFTEAAHFFVAFVKPVWENKITKGE